MERARHAPRRGRDHRVRRPAPALDAGAGVRGCAPVARRGRVGLQRVAVGDSLAVLLPRRESVAPAITAEQQHLPEIAMRLAPMRVPAPVVAGLPDAVFPWPWSVVPWVEGAAGHTIPRALRTGWATPLAAALRDLHAPASGAAPINPFRGVPLVARAGAMRDRLADAESSLPPASFRGLTRIWADGAVPGDDVGGHG